MSIFSVSVIHHDDEHEKLSSELEACQKNTGLQYKWSLASVGVAVPLAIFLKGNVAAFLLPLLAGFGADAYELHNACLPQLKALDLYNLKRVKRDLRTRIELAKIQEQTWLRYTENLELKDEQPKEL
ncbi:hypothetical protein AKO1_012416 [Acrasis kona]|uniref:Uncharacterized protein n=1 Tax=Acrasis kona TaxID=1008807 RepID=A0AAW2YWB2_9EUKA